MTVIDADYVLKQLEAHQAECARRWWSVMSLAIGNLVVLVAGMATIIVDLLSHHH
ncbi:MAG TPA: hypothetical protein VGF92_05460 [Stellaceae bacterium]|jgi:hypothetical protein